MKKYIGFVFKTTNMLTGMKYIGSHIGLSTDIDYGNSRFIDADINKYGIENLNREILEFAGNVASLEKLESDWIIKLNAKNNPMYYNTIDKQEIRGTCNVCLTNLVAINYRDASDRPHYRKLCSSCIRKSKKIKPQPPDWYKAGYRKQEKCENCGFRSKFIEQLRVFHLDGDKTNCRNYNLKTICLNCQIEALKSKTTWKPADIIADF
jgi:hypothetical protein